MIEENRDFLIRRSDLTETKWVSTPLPELGDGQVLLRSERFGFSANNVTYAARGENLFWKFFRAPDGWFRVPVWGFAVVVQSRHPEVPTGDRVYGYLPMSTFLVVDADQVAPAGFNDAAEHRAELPAIYNFYHRTAADPTYFRGRETEQALLRPLFRTSFVIDDYLGDNDFFGARRIIIGSASSKTALGVAFILSKKRKPDIEIVGLSSQSNLPFLNGLDYYDQVIAYDELRSLSIDQPTAYVDMSGDGAVRAEVHEHLGNTLCFDCRVGSTHWSRMDGAPVPGVQPTMFSMAEQMKKRLSEWGAAEFQRRYTEEWRSFLKSVDGWLDPVEGRGEAMVESVYQQMVAGRSSPERGHILSVSD